jgi:dolichol-phosphate mannosyltransferase
VVVPARDEEARIGPLLAALADDPQVGEVIVVDDQSSDATASLASAAGATVVRGAALPPGWVGKPWALHQGLLAATGHWLVTLDADVVTARASSARSPPTCRRPVPTC